MSDDGPTPRKRVGGETDAEQHTRTIRNTVDEHIFVRWYTGTPMSSHVCLHVHRPDVEERVVALDTIELPQAVRAFRDAGTPTDGSLIRDMGGFDRVWLETDGEIVALHSEAVGEIEHIVVFTPTEAGDVLAALEDAKEQIPRVEDDPYV